VATSSAPPPPLASAPAERAGGSFDPWLQGTSTLPSALELARALQRSPSAFVIFTSSLHLRKNEGYMGVYGELSKAGLPDLRVFFHITVAHWRAREATAWLTEERRRQLLARAAALLREPLRFASAEADSDGFRALLTIDVQSDLSAGWWGLQDTAATWTGGLEKRNWR